MRDLPDENSAAHFKSDRVVVVARKLRKSMTSAECALWTELRRLPLKGTHFRRQSPFGPFIVDFICHGARLIIEVDGGVHAAPGVASRDAERETWIKSRGYRLLRFTNAEVLKDARAVVQKIFAEATALKRPQIEVAPHP